MRINTVLYSLIRKGTHIIFTNHGTGALWENSLPPTFSRKAKISTTWTSARLIHTSSIFLINKFRQCYMLKNKKSPYSCEQAIYFIPRVYTIHILVSGSAF